MKNTQPSLVKGTRDFGPSIMNQRLYMLDIIKDVFKKYGFAPMETPAIENLTTLQGKYGQEGEQLIFKILDSGDYLKKVPSDTLPDHKSLTPHITHKGLRYDLTVPLARYIAQNRHELTLPFKRSQIQPVWRADKPQKGRFREFYQCDADIVGANHLFYETEIFAMIEEVFTSFGLHDYTIAYNHRLIFRALATELGIPEKETQLCLILDKLDKIGWEKVASLLAQEEITPPMLLTLKEALGIDLAQPPSLAHLADLLKKQEAGTQACKELQQVISHATTRGLAIDKIIFTPTLARGIGYYTGTIFEVTITSHPELGSLSGGGRYDDLATVFGIPPIPCVGFSFGLERIYEALHLRNLFPQKTHHTTQLLIVPMSPSQEKDAFQYLSQARNAHIITELYPVGPKLKKILTYASKKNIPWVAILGDDEGPGQSTLKNMVTGKQIICTFVQLLTHIQTPQQ